MLYIESLDKGLPIFKALASELRVEIIKLLLENKEMNMNEIAKSLNISRGALTSHIKKLDDSGIIRILSVTDNSGHGNQKIYCANVDRIVVDVHADEDKPKSEVYEEEIPIGHYSDYEVYPTCGIATKNELIGELDDQRYFAHPSRMNASILWFSKGYVEYLIPNLVPTAMKITEIVITMEISSEAPGIHEDWPSDISFLLNDVLIGTWTSPGDFGDKRGIFTPDWWASNLNQYGLLKMLAINERGIFIEGVQISETTIKEFDLDYKSTLKFKFVVSETATNIGGLTIFGRDFGNYNQGIKVRISYNPM